jgi:hypothetical protein
LSPVRVGLPMDARQTPPRKMNGGGVNMSH